MSTITFEACKNAWRKRLAVVWGKNIENRHANFGLLFDLPRFLQFQNVYPFNAT